MSTLVISIALVALMTSLPVAEQSTAREPIIGGSCEGCEYVFDGMPRTLDWAGRISPPEQKGTALRIDGVVRDRAGKPVPGVIVYAYQTDAGGLYPGGSTRHGGLRGWVKTDAAGRYRFDTIRPGGYPNTTIPQHIHMHVIEPGRATYYIDDIVFTDDPRLTPAERPRYVTGRGGNGLVTPVRRDGRLEVTRDIVLRQNLGGPGTEDSQ